MDKLFQNTKMGANTLKNRVIMAPLTRNRSHDDGTPAEMAIDYYTQRASGGLIITEATQISAMGKGYIKTPGIYNRDHIDGWAKIVKSVHEKGGKIFLQLWHVGRISHSSILPDGVDHPHAPSAIRAKAETVTEEGRTQVSEPKEMSLDEIKQTVKDYRHAAECAKEAGFDGVEIHAANGYLINQFLEDCSNKRNDEYGGSIENRMRFLNEIISEVASVWGPDRVGIRLSPTSTFNDMGDSDPLGTYTSVIKKLNTYGLAYLHIVEKFPGIDVSEEEQKTLKTLRNIWNGFYIANGDYGREDGIKAVESGHADAVCYGRIYIANPDLYERLKIDAELNEPNPDTFYGGGREGYTDYPFMSEKQKSKAA